jgi:hypothetical protein
VGLNEYLLISLNRLILTKLDIRHLRYTYVSLQPVLLPTLFKGINKFSAHLAEKRNIVLVAYTLNASIIRPVYTPLKLPIYTKLKQIAVTVAMPICSAP